MSQRIKEQTRQILDCLLDEREEEGTPLECDSDTSDEDVHQVAMRLREFGDACNDTIRQEMKRFKLDLQTSLAVGQGREMFSKIVNQLSENGTLQKELSQMGSEIGLLKIVVVLGIQAAHELPSMVPAIKNAMADFLNIRLLSWIQKSGGWKNIQLEKTTPSQSNGECL
ncbi:apoptosis regulator BAX-like [Callorhinchus milii]|nr:apoptosis regulator BAX-like [Callorhinchus milii]|eukprot:gi/632967095/ref/XP_007899789.1/ PREDICTED: apoptosis regulator BAX-like [Callorhinchus milii]